MENKETTKITKVIFTQEALELFGDGYRPKTNEEKKEKLPQKPKQKILERQLSLNI